MSPLVLRSFDFATATAGETPRVSKLSQHVVTKAPGSLFTL